MIVRREAVNNRQATKNAIVSKLISTGGQSLLTVLLPQWVIPSQLKNTDRREQAIISLWVMG
ncbi:hypothetical protein [Klebsiella pneumoniae]|uniref:hypothetical protein n=1 Tax=Klebsiella pneumoniae TaxID=573 RepID=UPI003559078C